MLKYPQAKRKIPLDDLNVTPIPLGGPVDYYACHCFGDMLGVVQWLYEQKIADSLGKWVKRTPLQVRYFANIKEIWIEFHKFSVRFYLMTNMKYSIVQILKKGQKRYISPKITENLTEQ